MARPAGRSEATFYFQAWHVDKVVAGESWLHNKAICDFVERNLGADSKKWLCLRACVPSKERPGLLVPYSICVKLRAPKSGQSQDEADHCVLRFRDQEYPAMARSYFLTRLRKTLDFFNAYAEGVDPGSPLADFGVVKSSKQLKERVQAAVRHVKRDEWGDMVHGLVGQSSPGADFKPSRFISKRRQDPKANPHQLSTAPLQTILLSSNGLGSPPPGPASEHSVFALGSTTSSLGSDTTSDCSSSDETAQSSVPEEPAECRGARESSEAPSTDNTSAPATCPKSSQASRSKDPSRSSAAVCDNPISPRSSKAVAPREKMNCVASADSQTTVFVLQDARQWLQYIMVSNGKARQHFDFDSPVVLAAAITPLQPLQPDGTLRIFFMSQLKKKQERDKKGQLACKGKATHEWVIGSAKVSARALTMQMQLQKQIEHRKDGSPPKDLVSVVGPNNQLIEMAPAQGIPEAIVVTTPHPAEDIKDGDILQHEKDGFVHVEANAVVDQAVEVAADKKEKARSEEKPRSSRGKKRAPRSRKTDADGFPSKPTKTYPHPFSHKSWRDEEPQAPQLMYDVTGSNFLHMEDIQVISFSQLRNEMTREGHSHRHRHRAAAAAPAAEESDGIKVWPPSVLGVFSWAWEHMSGGGWSRPTAQ